MWCDMSLVSLEGMICLHPPFRSDRQASSTRYDHVVPHAVVPAPSLTSSWSIGDEDTPHGGMAGQTDIWSSPNVQPLAQLERNPSRPDFRRTRLFQRAQAPTLRVLAENLSENQQDTIRRSLLGNLWHQWCNLCVVAGSQHPICQPRSSPSNTQIKG